MPAKQFFDKNWLKAEQTFITETNFMPTSRPSDDHATPTGYDSDLWKQALEIHQNILTLDTHSDTPALYLHKPFDLSQRRKEHHIDIPRMRAGGLKAQFFAAYVPTEHKAEKATARGMLLIDCIHRLIERYAKDFELADSAAEIRRIADRGRIAIAIGLENGEPLAGSLANLRNFHRLGVRYLTLTHWLNNHVADSSTDKERLWHGLSPFGKEVVRECNRLGVLIDVSHVHDDTAQQCLELSRSPIVATHSNAKAICEHPRNLNDDLIKKIAERGGVIQLNFFSDFLSKEHSEYDERMDAHERELQQFFVNREEVAERMAEWQAENPAPAPPPIELIMTHLQHIVKLTGSVEHVGFGSDFDGMRRVPEGLEDVSKIPKLTYHLLKLGYSRNDIQKIWGGNFLRVMEEAEKITSKA